MNTTPLPLLPMLAPLLLLTACGGPRIEQELKSSLALPGDCRVLHIEIPTGAVTVEAGEPGRIDVDAITGRIAANDAALARLAEIDFVPALVAGDAAGVYRFVLPGPPPDLDPRETAMIFRGLLRVPPEVAIRVHTARGDLAARGMRAAVALETEAGDLLLQDVAGPAEASTEHGNCTVTGQRGALRLRTGEGKIVAYLEAIDVGGVDLATTGTAIVCHVPPDAAFELDARVEESEEGKLSIRDAFGVPVRQEGQGHVARGTVNGGGPTLRLSVGRGWISVVGR